MRKTFPRERLGLWQRWDGIETGEWLTPAAQRDLSEISDFTAERWGGGQAEKYIAEIRAAVERVAADPERGRACHEIREGYRRLGIGSHLLFFVETAESVDIVGILHQPMDPTRYL